MTFRAWRPVGAAKSNFIKFLSGVALAASLAGCASFGSSGPGRDSILHSNNQPLADATISVVELTDGVARQLAASDRKPSFSDLFKEEAAARSLIGPGDVLEISMWEAPPAVLFGSAPVGLPEGLVPTSSNLSIPGSVVDEEGRISVPFAGSIVASGKTPAQIEREIVGRLRGKAHMPQASVRIGRNKAAVVTVVGDVAASGQVPLTPKGERLLDVLAGAGGAKSAVDKTVIQITRGNEVATMPLEAVIADPKQNIFAQSGDVISVLFQPYSFTALGATGNNSEHPIEATGISLAQALGRVGGIRDDRADARGVFVFRLTDPAKLGGQVPAATRLTADGKLPVIYRLDLRDPASFFAAQSFPIEDRDVLYVSKAPLADLQKFMNMVSSAAFSVIGVANAVDSNQ